MSLPKDLTDYLSKRFNVFIPDKNLKEKILDKYPMPSAECIKTPELDDYVPEIFSEKNASYGKSYDTNLHQMQNRIGTVMGPLSKMWLDLDYMSPIVRKLAFCICENKDADQLRGNREADQRLCFRYMDSAVPLLSKSEITCL